VNVRSIGLASLLAVASLPGFGQANRYQQPNQVITTSGTTSSPFYDKIGSVTHTYSFVIAGGPSAMSIPIQGCMRATNGGPTGNCTTITTYSSTSSGATTFTGAYDYYQYIPTFSGGTNVSVTSIPTDFVSRLPSSGNSGVSQIVAGTGVTITPSGGTGAVTINSTGSGSGITALTGDVAASGTGTVAATVQGINGVSLAGLSTCLLKNTTGTGVPTCGAAGTDYIQGPLTGDVTTSGNTATVVQVEGAAIPTSAPVVGTNSSKQLIQSVSTFNGGSAYLQGNNPLYSGSVNFGDSTNAGTGASIAAMIFGAQLQNDIGGPWTNYGFAGFYTQGVADAAWGKWNPALAAPYPIVTYQGGINDANATTGGAGGNTTGGLNMATLAVTAGVTHLALPIASVTMSSVAASTGTWAAFTNAVNLPLSPGLTGTMMSSTTNASTRTYTLAASPELVYTWAANDASAGTFTVSVNGSLQTNLCTGTTTFDSFGCNSATIVVNGGLAFFSQVFAGNAGSANTVVITVTSATNAANIVYDVGVTTTATLGNSPIFVQGVQKQASDTDSAATAAYNTVISNEVTALRTAGLTNVYFVDPRNGIAAGTNYPAARALNTTTDYTSASCGGGLANLHFNDCGYQALVKLYESTAASDGYFLAIPQVPNRGTGQPGPIVGQENVNLSATIPFGNDWLVNPGGTNSATSHMPGIGLYSASPLTTGTVSNGRIAYEEAGPNTGFSIKVEGSGSAPFAVCTVNGLLASTDVCPLIFSAQPSFGSYLGAPTHIGPLAGFLSAHITNSTINSLSLDSMQAVTTSTSPTATTVYMKTGTTAIAIQPCGVTASSYAGNWIEFFIKDSADTNAITFTANASAPADTINGAATYVIPGTAPEDTQWVLRCSQTVATQGTLSMTEILPAPSSASLFLQASTGNLTSIVANGQFGPVKVVRSGTLENIEATASTFSTCSPNPTLTLEDCGTSAGTCSSPSALGSVTLTAANTLTDGSVTSATITAGHYITWETTAGTCVGLNASVSAEYR
jgi:hypothetical protein